MIVNEIALDLRHPSNVVIHVNQGERDARQAQITLLDNGTPWAVPAGATIAVMFGRKDGTGGAYELLEDNETPAVQLNTARTVALVSFVQSVASVAGVVQMSILFRFDGGQRRLISFPWFVVVHPLMGGETASENFFNLLFDAISDISGLTEVIQAWAAEQCGIARETKELIALIAQAVTCCASQ